MKSRLAELKALADEIAAEITWKEPWQRRAFGDGVEWALKAAAVSLNEPSMARMRTIEGDKQIDREVAVIPYPAWDVTKGGES